jgi:hypothetical protein
VGQDGQQRIARPSQRERVTVDLRGLGEQLHRLAATQGTSSAALVRRSLRALLDQGDTHGDGHAIDGGESVRVGKLVKITLRLPAVHALLLVRRARTAEVSQGDYVAGLIEGTPRIPPAPDHAQAIAALARSTDQLAATSADLNAFMRLVGRVPQSQLEPYRARIQTLEVDVRRHLTLAAALMAALKPARGRR